MLVERPDAAADTGDDCATGGGCAVDAPPDRLLGPGVLGQACAAGGECATGFCFDGVCCDGDCSAACQSCAQAGTVGSCVPAEMGSDPREDCADDGASSCGLDGTCDGLGGCRHYAAGLICRPSSCDVSTLTQAFRCSGAGECRPTSGLPCDPYLCDVDGLRCRTSCATSADCTAGRVCVAGKCGRNPLGAACATGDDCNSDLCQQNVCCSTACTATCSSCALPSSQGICTQVPAGQDPLAQCADETAASCGMNGSCDGAGACQRYPASTVCIPVSCVGSTFTQSGTCNGSGTCRPAPAIDCGRYQCTLAGCRTTCVTTADCTLGSECILGICGAPTNLKLQYLCGAPVVTDSGPKPEFKIVNLAVTPVVLAQLTIRYWYTEDATVAQSVAIDYADVGAVNVTGTFVRLPVARPMADVYLEIGFTAAAGSLAGGGAGTIMLARFNKNDFTNYNQSNDYSFDATKLAFADWDRVTLYRNGVLVWGTEPPAP